MAKLLKFFMVMLLLEMGLLLVALALFPLKGALVFFLFLSLVFFVAFCVAPSLLMGQINGKMASSSTHLEDFLVLETISRQYGVNSPTFYLYDSNQINAYLVKGLFNSSVLAISSECFSSMSLEERGLLYKYQIMRLQFPWHVYVETGLSVLLLFSMGAIDVLFSPISMMRKIIFGMGSGDLQKILKLLILPFLNFCKNVILGVEKHSYIRSILTTNISRESFMPIYFKAQQSFLEKSLEYDFLSCNGFMGFENDLFNASTEKHEFKNYMWS